MAKPTLRHSATAALLVLTTKLNCMARNPLRRASRRQCSAICLPTPLPLKARATMKDAFATCEPRPGWFGTILYIPTTRPSASTTYEVTPGPIQ